MKIQIYAKDLLKILPQYKDIIMSDYNKYTELLEEANYNIAKFQNKTIKHIFEIQLSTKEDFNIEVIDKNGEWDINNINKDVLVALLLRNEKLVLNIDTTSLKNVDVIEYFSHKYDIYVKKYEEVNYVGEGNINWNNINNEVKENWEKSFFFLEHMNNNQFVENNKKLILEKVKDDKNLLKETLNKSIPFFQYAIQKINVERLLEILEDNEGCLAEVWNNKIKNLQEQSNYKKLIEYEQYEMNQELSRYWDYMVSNSVNSYGEMADTSQYNRIRDRLTKDLKTKEKELKRQAEENQIILKEINKLIQKPTLRKNLIKGLLKNNIFKEDFELFEDDIIKDEELTNLVLRKGLYKTLAVTKNFVDNLSREQFEIFIKTCSQRLEKSAFAGDDKKHFQKIVNENKLLPILQEIIESGKIISDKDFKILSEYNTKNKQMKKSLFYLFPKERFSELSKDEITEQDVMHYLNSDGYVYNVKEKLNIYTFTDIETIKLLCSQDGEVLRSKKAPIEWKNNIEIIKSIVKSKGDLEYCGVKRENVLEMSKDINATIEIVREDKKQFFYKNLPIKLKNDKQIAAALLDSTKEVKEVIDLLPEFILKDKRFNIEIIKKEPNAIMYLNEDIWNDKEFVLTLFYEVENTAKEKEIGKNLPSKIKLFFETFNIQENYYTFFNNYQLQKKLEKKLVSQEDKENNKRLKI